MQKYGFIYLWYDRKPKKYYIGRHWGTEEDGYVCSSKSMREAHRRRPQDFRRRIVSRIDTNQVDLINEEQRWLDMIKKEELNNRYYNKTNRSTTPSTRGYKHSQETVEKIRTGNRGRVVSDETRQKISKSVSGTMTTEHRERLSQKCSGWTHTDEAKEKIRQAGIGRVYSDETRQKIGAAQKGKVVSDETRQKLRNAILGKTRGPYRKKEDRL